MGNKFESSRRYMDKTEIIPDRFGFKSAGKKYINHNYKRIGHVLGVEGEGLGNIKKQAKEENQIPDIHGYLSLDQINFYRGHYNFPPLTNDEYKAIKAQNTGSEVIKDEKSGEVLTEVDQPKIDLDGQQESNPAKEVPSTYIVPEEFAPTQEIPELKAIDSEDDGEALPKLGELQEALDSLGEELATKESSLVDENSNTLQQELDRLIVETDQRLSRESEPNKEKLERFKDNARQAISNFQQFARDHSSPADKANSNVQEQYRQYENTAWDELYKLAHLLDGEIVTLPQDRDIQLSHPEGVDTKEYLKQIGYKFDEKGDIVEIMNKGVNIRLNRARTIQNLINSKRPSHLLYNKSFTLEDEDNDIYQGYIIEGLNLNTPDWMEIVLNNKQFLEPVIVDEISQSDNSSEYTQDPWERKSKGETEFDKIFTDSNKVTGVTQVSNKIPDPWVKQSELLENTAQSTEKSDTLELYRQQGFNEAQLAFINQVIDAGDTTDEIALYAKLEYEVAQMMVEREKKLNPNLDISQYEGLPHWQQAWIINGIRAGHTSEQISLYAKSGINSNEIEEIQRDIQNGLTIEQINEKQIEPIIESYLNMNVGFSRNNLIRQLESEEFTNEQVTQVIDSMNIDWSQQAIKKAKSYLESREPSIVNWSKNELTEQLEYEGFTSEEARLAVDNISDYDWKEEEVTDPETTEQDRGGETTPQVSLDDLRLAYAKAEEAWNRKRGDLKLENAFESAREDYNTELERVLKLQVAKGQEANISQMFKDEVIALRESRKTQSQELQGKWEKRFNGAKEKFLGWATKNKTRWMLANIGLFAAGALLSSTGAGIPVSGALEMTRRSLGSVMSGVGARNTLVGLMEDGEINRFGIKFKAVIPKLVDESLKDNYINNASDDDLSTKLSTLEAYYRLNGGEFPQKKQQQAYEKVLNELGNRVRIKSLENYHNDNKVQESNLDNQSETNNQTENSIQSSEIVHINSFNFDESGQSSRYTSELLNTISDTRITELDKFRRKRKIANVVGVATTGVLGGLLLNDMVKPGSMFRPDIEGSGKPPTTGGGDTPEVKGTGAGPGGAGAPETGGGVPKPNFDTTPPTGTGAGSGEALNQVANERFQDASNLAPKETVWGEIREWLGPNASEAQVKQVFENYVNSSEGQNTIFNLAKQTEEGRELLSKWGIDNAGEMAGLSKDQLYEVSKYLGEGKLDGLTELSPANLDALEQAEYVAPSSTESPNIEPGSTETPAPPAGTEDIGSKPPAPSSPVEASVNTSQFTKSLSEAIGANNLTDSQIGSVLEAYSDTDQGRESLYNMIITSEANNSNISYLLTEYNVIDIYDFADLSDNQLYALAQEVGVENLDKLPGFKLNEIILSKFEDAPDTVELVKGLSPLDAVQRYIANELGNLPYDSGLAKKTIDAYLDTPEGKDWFLKSITENIDGAPAKGDIRFMNARLFFSRNGITQGSDIDWNKLDQLRNGFVKHKIFWQDFPFKVDDKTVNLSLSRLLKPGPMPGIKDAVRQVLTRQ
jgi:hypothetical protein